MTTWRVLVLAAAACATWAAEAYTLPEPLVEASGPARGGGGLRVSIPDAEGVHLFAFHGNVNRPIGELEAGELSADVVRRDARGRWTYRSPHTRLGPGDALHYWIYVIRDGIGYRSPVRVFRVPEIDDIISNTAQPQEATFPAVTPQRQRPASGGGPMRQRPQPQQVEEGSHNKDATTEVHPSGDGCERALDSIAQASAQLRHEVDELREENSVLREVAQAAAGESRGRLTLRGRLPEDAEGADPLQTTRQVLRELLHVSVNPVSATRNADGSITFHVATLQEQVTALRAAHRLPHSRIHLEL